MLPDTISHSPAVDLRIGCRHHGVAASCPRRLQHRSCHASTFHLIGHPRHYLCLAAWPGNQHFVVLAACLAAHHRFARRRGRVRLLLRGIRDAQHGECREDPHCWLEDLEAPEVLRWVAAQNEATLKAYGEPKQSPLFKRFLVTETTDIGTDPLRKLPQVTKIGDMYYDFWSDPFYPRGVWRRVTLEEYSQPSPAWEIVLSLDQLGTKEGESWVWRGFVPLDEGPGKPTNRCLVQLSRGGADAFVAREFDLTTKEFVSPEAGGFVVPEAKSILCYRNKDVLLVSSDFGEGSLTAAGYPRTVRAWRRGTPLADAAVMFEGSFSDCTVYAYAVHERGGHCYEVVHRATSYYSAKRLLSLDIGCHFAGLCVPEDASLSFFGGQLVLWIKSDFKPSSDQRTFHAGSLLAAEAQVVLQGEDFDWHVIWEPDQAPGPAVVRSQSDEISVASGTPRFSTLQNVVSTRSHLVLVTLVNVRPRFVAFRLEDGHWIQVGQSAEGEVASVSVRAVDPLNSDAIWLGSASYGEPPALFRIPDVGAWASAGAQLPPRGLNSTKRLLPVFDATGLVTEQMETTSADGTRVPYYVTKQQGITSGGPTLIYAYGGFELPVLPTYQGTVGAAWLEQGGTYVEANIRGGNEFGPQWSDVARRGGRQRAYEDLEAVADDLCARGLTSPRRLGLLGRSNGGLLVGNMLTRSPTRFGALVGEVPLLDMRIYHRLLAGASWIEEYGDPDDPGGWSQLRTISPYHLLDDKDASVTYPPVLFTTSRRDDRVHPCHARKMVCKLQALRDARMGDACLFESAEGGHVGAASIEERAFLKTLEYEFLWHHLGRGWNEGKRAIERC